VEPADDLGDAGARPNVEERRLEQRGDLAAAAGLRLILGLPRPRFAKGAEHAVLVVDGRILDVTVELDEVAGEEDRDRHGRELLAVLLVGVLAHEVGIGV